MIEGWANAIDPDGDCRFTVEDGRLVIGVPDTPHDLSAELGRMNAPRVLTKVCGDFTVEVKVGGTFAPGGPTIATRTAYNGAGLLLMKDEKIYLRLDRAVLVRGWMRQAYANFELRVDGKLDRLGIPADYLRLLRQPHSTANCGKPGPAA